MAQLHPGARWTFRTASYKGVGIWFGLLIFIGLGQLRATISWSTGIPAFFAMVFISIMVPVVVGELYARLSYRFFSYEFTDEYIHVNRGIIWRKSSQIPYERVQDVMIQRTMMARWLGFSELFINTAGTTLFEGHIPGIAAQDAEKMREFLMKKTQENNQGF